MVGCTCGRKFKSEQGLADHRTERARRSGTTTVDAFVCQPIAPPAPAVKKEQPAKTEMPPGAAVRGEWMWKHVKNRVAIHSITASTLQSSATAVSSVLGYELVCSYSWQNCKAPILDIPGSPPIWHGSSLPITLPEDKGIYFVDQNASRVPYHRFEPLFRATAAMTPTFRFDNVDVISNRNSLRKLLDFCSGRTRDNFRIDLMLVNNTLFLERRERKVRELIRGASQSGWGHSFEQAFTKFPPGAEDSTGYHRALHYPLGELRCVVQFEIDAFYNGEKEEKAEEEDDSITLQMTRLSLQDKPALEALPAQAPPGSSQQTTTLMPQSTAAEIKTTRKVKKLKDCLPQLWFGRTPWLIAGHHKDGTFDEVKITDASDQFQLWEARNQKQLRKLVAVLTELREAVRKNGGKRCIAIYDKRAATRDIQILESEEDRKALPEEWIARFWTAGDK